MRKEEKRVERGEWERQERDERGERAGMGKLKIFGLHGDDFLRR